MYGYDRGGKQRWLGPRVAMGGLLLLMAVGGAYLLGSHTAAPSGPAISEAESATAPAATSLPAPGAPTAFLAAAQPSSDPLASAVEWLRAYHSLSHADPVPTAWIDRIRPVVSEDLAEEYELYRDGSAGAEWADFVAERCLSVVEDTGGVIPDEAPRTNSEVSVQVIGTLQTRCEGSTPSVEGPQALAATVLLVRDDDGLWVVDQWLY